MKEVAVYYGDINWGTLLETDKRQIYFEYSAEALASGVELSPLKCKLAAGVLKDFPEHQFRLPGFIYDCLPDGWGMLLMDRMFEKNNISYISPLDRLTYANHNMIGALRFEPTKNTPISHSVDLLDIAKQSQKVYADTANKDALLSLIQYGGSAHGARPKILLYSDGSTITDAPSEGLSPWIFKFQCQDDKKESAGLEQIYMEMAQKSGLEVMPSKYIPLDKNNSCFATKRFDVVGPQRLHVHTLAGLTHANFRTPGNLDYSMYLRVVNFLTKDNLELEKAFAYCAFNYVYNNIDDHPKNFSFILEAGKWRVSPAYDLTYLPGREHYMAVGSKGSNVSLKDLLDLGKSFGVKSSQAIIDRICATAIEFKKLYKDNDYEVSSKVVSTVAATIESNVQTIYKGYVNVKKNKKHD